MTTRNSGLDLFRILCCLGVLGYHVLDDIIFFCGFPAMTLYFLSSFCVPGFFLLQGYLLEGFCERGALPVIWFLFPYCLFVLAGYPLYQLQKHRPLLFGLLCIAWLVLFAAGFRFRQEPQSRWVWLYMGYFVAGMALSTLWDVVQSRIPRPLQAIAAGGVFAVCLIIYLFQVIFPSAGFLSPDAYYGTGIYSCWLLSLFWLTMLLPVRQAKARSLLARAGDNTLVVYLGHFPVLSYIVGLSPLQHTRTALLYILLLFAGLQLAAEGFRRVPLLRNSV